MKQLIKIILFLFISSIAFAEENSVIKMSEIIKAGHVVVKPSIEYNIDFTGYEVPSDANLLVLHVLTSPKSHYYYQKIEPGKTLYSLNSNTLRPSKESPAFKSLNSNDSAFIIIGSETQPGSINMGILYANKSISVIIRDE